MSEHQSKLQPKDNKFHKGNGADGKHYWLTPKELFKNLSEKYGEFNFDPCPYPLPEGFDGLTADWGSANYVNPPFGSIVHEGKKKGPTAWVRKAIEEFKKGKKVVLVYPVDKWFLMLVEAGAKISNLGDVKWVATEDGSQGKGTGRHIACFVLDPVDQKNVWDSFWNDRMRLYNKKEVEYIMQRCEEEGRPYQLTRNGKDNYLMKCLS